MTGSSDHNAILERVARARLEPLGLVQKGRSRVWLDDRVWFATMVEFQPSGWEKGSYLNVGASWLWWPNREVLSFDQGYRVQDFKPAAEAIMEATCGALADRAARRCLEIREEFRDIQAASARLNRRTRALAVQGMADAGVAAALAGDMARARLRFEAVCAATATMEGAEGLYREVRGLLDQLADPSGFREARIADIQRCRHRVRLPDIEDGAIRTALASRQDHRNVPRRFAAAFGALRKRS